MMRCSVLKRRALLICSSIIGGTTMEQYVGIDVSLENASVCVWIDWPDRA
jgi:hypothetical protein